VTARAWIGVAAAALLSLPAVTYGQPRTDGAQQPRPPDDPHAGHVHEPPAQPPAPAEATSTQLPDYIPKPTDEDRAAAFPDLGGHAAHDAAVHAYVLFDQLEWHPGRDDSGFDLDSRGWIGGDVSRLWFRAEADRDLGLVEDAQTHVLYGRLVSRWWDLVGGLRQDFKPGSPQTWAAVGIQGLAPYWLQVEATGYVGRGGRTQARLEVEYELLLTNRLVLQPLVEIELYGRSDPARRVGAGLSTTEAGFRLRYEIRRELAPYVGLKWTRKYGSTADFAEADDDPTHAVRFVTGVRFWF
jgi:copper resistance protein B